MDSATVRKDSLRDDYYNLSVKQYPLADGFLYRHKVHMIYADPGVGKSTITQQLALELSSGKPLFRYLEVSQPARVYYLQLEGDIQESIERMRLMCKFGTEDHIPPNFDNLYWDRDHVGLNVMDRKEVVALIEDIRSVMPEPDLIIIDPIYQAIEGDLTKSDTVNLYCRFSSFISRVLNCALLHVHHSPKDTFNRDGEKVNKETFYGSQWFAAHMNGMYYLKSVDKKNGKSSLINKKQRNSNLLDQIDLNYDIESHSVYMESDLSKQSGKLKILAFLKECKKSDKWATMRQIIENSHLTCTWARDLTGTMVKSNQIVVDKSNKREHLYAVSTG